MDPLQNNHIARFQFILAAVVFPFSCHEVELGNLDFLAGKNLYEIVFQSLVVDSVEIVEVRGTVGQKRGFLPVDEIIIRTESQGPQSAGLKLYAETFGNRGFA